jgi:hypothetical protein
MKIQKRTIFVLLTTVIATLAVNYIFLYIGILFKIMNLIVNVFDYFESRNHTGENALSRGENITLGYSLVALIIITFFILYYIINKNLFLPKQRKSD